MKSFCWVKKKGQPKVEGEAANFGNSSNGGDSPGICLLITQHESDLLDDDIWIADSGASSHMTYSKDGMFDTEEVEEQVSLGNNHVVQGLMRGKLQVQLDTMNGKTTVQLTNVLYVPELCYNLFSVGVIANMGGKVSFGSNSVLIETSNGQKLQLPRSKEIAKLYGIGCTRCVGKRRQGASCLLLNTGVKVDINEAHQLLGHVGNDEMRKTAKAFGWTLTGKLNVCESCCKAKGRQKNLPGEEKDRAKKPGERLFIDIARCQQEKYWRFQVLVDCGG